MPDPTYRGTLNVTHINLEVVTRLGAGNRDWAGYRIRASQASKDFIEVSINHIGRGDGPTMCILSLDDNGLT